MKVTELKADDGRWEGEWMTPGNLDPYEWAILRRAKGAELGPVLETIENALRGLTRLN